MANSLSGFEPLETSPTT